MEIPDQWMTGTQRILATQSKFGWYRDCLGDDSLTLHELAGVIWSKVSNLNVERAPYEMPTEKELGFSLLRLLEEGLIGMDSKGGWQVARKPEVKVEKTHEAAVLPTYGKPGDAGADVYSCTETVIQPGRRGLIDLGIKIEIEPGWEVQVRPRSGLALKKGITVLNTPGTVDSGYRGNVGVILYNASSEPFPVRVGDRIAQFVIKRAPQAKFSWTDSVSETDRGEGGFGSTGV